MNVFFDGYINLKTTLKQFVKQYEVALQAKCEKEAQAKFDCAHKRPNLLTQFAFEQQLSETYTLTMFKKSQEEIANAMYCEVSLTRQNGSLFIYSVSELMKLMEPPITFEKMYIVE